MGFEQRSGRQYFYKKQRVGRTVRSIYVPPAEAQQAAQEAQEAQERREAAQELRASVREAATNVKQAHAAVRAEMAARLHDGGYHMHKRQWRKRRA